MRVCVAALWQGVNFTSNDVGGLVVVSVLISAGVTLLWMLIGWRAMRAHERLAAAAERLADQRGE